MYISPEIVFGFHGCNKEIANKVIKENQHLSFSENSYDWLGHGIYFWEGSYERAFEWAINKKLENPAVVGAVIKLGNCLDLLDSKHINKLKLSYEILEKEFDDINEKLPINKAFKHGFSFARDLDCRVIMRLHELNNESIAKEIGIEKITKKNIIQIQKHPQFIDSVRGMFPEGEELYPGAGFRSKNHIQLCITNPNCIIGYFDPIEPDKNFKTI
jgi:hypothetical protein